MSYLCKLMVYSSLSDVHILCVDDNGDSVQIINKSSLVSKLLLGCCIDYAFFVFV